MGGCSIYPSNHIFNTPIDQLPVDPNSSAYLNTIDSTLKRKLHLDLGTSTDMTQPDTYWGIPYNVIHSKSLTWSQVSYTSTDTADMSWDPTAEADCASGSAHTVVAPCTKANAPTPLLPIPASPLVEGGIEVDNTSSSYGDHHMLLLDADTCRVWEMYHCYKAQTGNTWNIFGSATWDLNSNALRPADWTSADAAGFSILALLLREDEAASGVIRHALRFTIQSGNIRAQYIWPARHLTGKNASLSAPPMGQLFRLKSSFAIPAGWNTQSKAIAQALKTYGMYIADGGSDMYIQGDPNGSWEDATFSNVQSIGIASFEAVDLSPIHKRAGFNANSAAVPPP